MTIKFYTIQNPPPVLSEPESQLPDECRQSDYIPLETLLQRFIATGGQLQYMMAQGLSAEEKEALYNEPDFEDEDIAVQKAFADGILNKVIKEQEKKEPTRSVKQDEPEKKPETAENA